MYKILYFSGGVYKFDLLAEHVEDVGGLLIQENRLQKSRGSYFLSEEIQVIFIVPPNEVSSIELMAREIKGEIQEMELEESLKNNLINSLGIFNILCKDGDWINPDAIIKTKEYDLNNHTSLEYNQPLNEYSGLDDDNKVLSNLEECLNLMLSLKLIEKRDNKGKSEYRILKDDDNL
jgi:Uncharacterized protein related to methyl coenzyme M reductase subunit C